MDLYFQVKQEGLGVDLLVGTHLLDLNKEGVTKMPARREELSDLFGRVAQTFKLLLDNVCVSARRHALKFKFELLLL